MSNSDVENMSQCNRMVYKTSHMNIELSYVDGW